MKIQAIIAAAGNGERLGQNIPKALVRLNGKALLIYSLKIFVSHQRISSVIVAAHSDYLKAFETLIKCEDHQRDIRLISGGATRQESVSRGLGHVDSDAELVLVHDAARPLISAVLVDRVIEASISHRAAVAAVPLTSTVKQGDFSGNWVKQTHDRSRLWSAQTPQGFTQEIIKKAHQQARGQDASDDAYLVEQMSAPVRIVYGEETNIKITTKWDLFVAEQILNRMIYDQ